VLLLNSPRQPDEIWTALPQQTQRILKKKRARLFVIDASRVARECGMGGRINTIMQTCFFSVSGVLPHHEAISAIKDSIRKTYGKKGEEIVQMNLTAVDMTLAHLHEVRVPSCEGADDENTPGTQNRVATCTQPAGDAQLHNGWSSELLLAGKKGEPDLGVPRRTGATSRTAFETWTLPALLGGRGDELPVSALPCDGTFPSGTARLEKRNLATEIPVWDSEVCIQCGKCVVVCPHAVIRSKVYESELLGSAPSTFKSRDARAPEWKGLKYTLQIAPEDCTGCAICVEVCPARNKSEARLKAINMRPQPELRAAERANWEFFLSLPQFDRRRVATNTLRALQPLEPLFEFSGACAGCGETPYLKLLSQLFGDRLLIANATGCSSIYGGNLPTTPWAANKEGRGPAWSNSLFEDNAEFGLGFRVSLDKQREWATESLEEISWQVGEKLARRILENEQRDEADIYEQRAAVAELKRKLLTINSDQARRLVTVADVLVRRSVWIIGGDGWAYDIGYGGLDHVLASGRNVKVLVLDTEVYSNTGGQTSKATPRGAVAKFAAGGKPTAKKDLGLMAMTYGNVYVASVAMGAKDEQTLKALLEAEAYDGPALVIAYCHCIAHGINMSTAMQNQKAAVTSGQWLLYRFNPDRAKRGENPLLLDSPPPRSKVAEYLNLENRFRMLAKIKPQEARTYYEQTQLDVDTRWQLYQSLAARPFGAKATPPGSMPSSSTGASQPQDKA
jgi:pyruvate-ferredoxin/flavodoxin oxidoreductase